MLTYVAPLGLPAHTGPEIDPRKWAHVNEVIYRPRVGWSLPVEAADAWEVVEYADGSLLVCITQGTGEAWSDVTPDPSYEPRTYFFAVHEVGHAGPNTFITGGAWDDFWPSKEA